MNWWLRVWRRRRLDEQLVRELQSHLDHHIADLVSSGVPAGEARRLAQLALGGREAVKEQCRDVRGTQWLDDLAHDVRYALRSLRLNPGFAVVAVLTLALGIGATTVMFSMIDGVLFKPLPFADPGSLLKIDEQTKGRSDYRWGDRWAFSYPNFLDCQRDVHALRIAAYRWNGGTISGAGDPEYVDAIQVSADFLPLLGVTPALGRMFLQDEDRAGAPPAAMISYALWQRRFAGQPSVLERPLVFDGQTYTVVGVAPRSFTLENADVLTPLGQNVLPFMRNRAVHAGFHVWARTIPGTTIARAQAELDAAGAHLAAEFPVSNAGRGFIVEAFRPDVGDVRPTLWLLLGAVSLVLLIACVNVASLLLARAVSRDREVVMRVALGAGRGRLVRQYLTESMVLGVSGGLLGVWLASVGAHPFALLWPGGLPRAEGVQVDGRVLLFAVFVSVACSALFGLAPIMRSPGRGAESALRAGARTVSGSRRVHHTFVIAEIALALVLLVSAGLLGSALLRLSTVNPGVDVHNVLTSRMALSPAIVGDPARIRAAWQEILDQGHRVAGVRAITLLDTVPMRSGNNQIGYWTSPAEPAQPDKPLVLANSVTPEYLDVMRIPLRRGRFFDDHDRIGGARVAVIDEVLAQHAFGGEDPIGRTIHTDLVPEPLLVVGVVGHVRYWGLAGDDGAHVRDQLYYPFAQVPDSYLRRWSELMSIAVRTNVEPVSLVERLRHELRGAGRDQVLYDTASLEQLAHATLDRQRFLLVLFATLAGLALTLACVGIYGVLAYLTGQRAPEFGVRLALGATARDIMALVLGQSARMVMIGVAIGGAASSAAVIVLSRYVEGVRAIEPVAFAVMTSALALSAFLASAVPAMRASRVDPATALRGE